MMGLGCTAVRQAPGRSLASYTLCGKIYQLIILSLFERQPPSDSYLLGYSIHSVRYGMFLYFSSTGVDSSAYVCDDVSIDG